MNILWIEKEQKNDLYEVLKNPQQVGNAGAYEVIALLIISIIRDTILEIRARIPYLLMIL
jgi:hypothetical protein